MAATSDGIYQRAGVLRNREDSRKGSIRPGKTCSTQKDRVVSGDKASEKEEHDAHRGVPIAERDRSSQNVPASEHNQPSRHLREQRVLLYCSRLHGGF